MKYSCSKILETLSLLIIISCFAGCKKADEELVLKTTTANITSMQTFKLVVSPDINGCEFESENELIASVSSTGLITAHLVGETHIMVNNPARGFASKCSVTVQPEHVLYKDPYLLFGNTKKNIKDYETRYLYLEDDSTLIYVGENSSIAAVFYYLESAAYIESTCLIPATNTAQFEDFIAERYYLLDTGDDFRILMTPDSTTLVGVESGITLESGTYFAVHYIAYPTFKTNGVFKVNSDLIKKSEFLR